jgi:hypothetical protein
MLSEKWGNVLLPQTLTGHLIPNSTPMCGSIDDPEQYNGSTQGSQKRPDNPASTYPDESKYRATDKTSDDTNNNIPQNVELVTLDQTIGNSPGNAADHNPDNPGPQ